MKSAALLSAGALVSPALLAAPTQYIGLQLYTVRDAMQQDPTGTLAKVAQLGYNSVEGATYTGTQKFYGMEPAAFAKTLKQHGLIMPSSHYVLGMAENQGKPVQGTILHGWDKAVDDAAQVGIKYMVCAYLQESERGNLDQYKRLAEALNKAGQRCKKAGIQLCYHNHDFEFVAQDGKLPYDILLKQTDKDLLKMELDLYWASKAGHDPVTLFQQNPGRFPLWHMKDMDKTEKHDFTEVGNGSIDFKKIYAQRKLAGLQYFFVEQDRTPGSPFDSIRSSISYIKGTLL
ncbi:sugar phosphate isomerase/epimerase [Hymenobacter sp. GOD-10R]|uniref:sugar phosphate isomerase/epimerase family protein n=1 Tax=Hymenobacter sp. GOD-10R TaxID=3093922 RepID=UPI002D76DD4A|nr:sugar phosphate isomerase/epimerase [Hymenobacter sp. GOD-10R]WRQ30727.1 sugar phosphate isomerase/epimerase [Hymenobacter sp. GOD-10R]